MKRSSIATMALVSALSASAVAQLPTPKPQRGGVPSGVQMPLTPTPSAAQAPPATSASTAPAPKDNKVYRSSDALPETTIVPGSGEIPLPDGPIEPFLVQPENGPFMVCAKPFRGPEATRYAMALVLELRGEYQLPAYLYQLKVKPGGFNIRNVPPTAPPNARNTELAPPEKFRTYDEAVVLIGNCKDIDAANKLLHSVKKIHPKCLAGMGGILPRLGAGLKYSFVTQNPLVPSQNIFPGRGIRMHGGQDFDPFAAVASLTRAKPNNDPVVARINSGPRSVYKCPGPYTIQVAEFTGRSGINESESQFDKRMEKLSPLKTAHDDAEYLADVLSRYSDWIGGQHVYVYHDRTSSRVLIGSFRSSDDPELRALAKRLVDEVPPKVVQDSRIKHPLPLTTVLLGTPEGMNLYDAMVQRTSNIMPPFIPFPAKAK